MIEALGSLALSRVSQSPWRSGERQQSRAAREGGDSGKSFAAALFPSSWRSSRTPCQARELAQKSFEEAQAHVAYQNIVLPLSSAAEHSTSDSKALADDDELVSKSRRPDDECYYS